MVESSCKVFLRLLLCIYVKIRELKVICCGCRLCECILFISFNVLSGLFDCE